MKIEGVQKCLDMHVWKYKANYYIFDARIILDDEGDNEEVHDQVTKLLSRYSSIKKHYIHIEDRDYRAVFPIAG